MKNDITRLVKLAKQYVDYCKSINVKEGFTTYIKDEHNCRVYMSSRHQTYSIQFNDIEVQVYSGTIQMPFGTTSKLLKELNLTFTELLTDLTVNIEENLKLAKEERTESIQKQIQELEKEILTLKK